MSGGGGGIIIRNATKKTLSDPIIHGQLPADMAADLAPVLVKDTCDWSVTDCAIASEAHTWALCNLK